MIVVINFADKNFKRQQDDNCQTALSIGKADKVFAYHPEDIDEKFFKSNSQICEVKRGYGLWIWKAYFVLRTLELMDYGDYLFYCDAGSYFVNDLHLLVNVLENENIDIMPFELPLLERQWTKMETYKRMKVDEMNNNQCLASYFLIKKTDFSIKFMIEWLDYMKDPICILPQNVTGTPNISDFIVHREDQSVFSLLCHKYKLQTFRDPSQYGDWPWLYKKDYATFVPHEYPNSIYPRILVSNRRIPMNQFEKTIQIQNVLHNWGLYYWGCKVRKFMKRMIYGKESKDIANIQ